MATPARIDWEAARQHWLSQEPPRTFTATARAFNCSIRGVSYRAHAEGWLKDADLIDREARRSFMRKAIRARADRLADRERLLDEMLTTAWEDVLGGRLEIRASDVPGLIKAEQLLLGEATDRIDHGQALLMIRMSLGVSLRLVERLEQVDSAGEWREWTLGQYETIAGQISSGASGEDAA